MFFFVVVVVFIVAVFIIVVVVVVVDIAALICIDVSFRGDIIDDGSSELIHRAPYFDSLSSNRNSIKAWWFTLPISVGFSNYNMYQYFRKMRFDKKEIKTYMIRTEWTSDLFFIDQGRNMAHVGPRSLKRLKKTFRWQTDRQSERLRRFVVTNNGSCLGYQLNMLPTSSAPKESDGREIQVWPGPIWLRADGPYRGSYHFGALRHISPYFDFS